MPFASDKQRKFLYATRPDVARKLAEHDPPKPKQPRKARPRRMRQKPRR